MTIDDAGPNMTGRRSITEEARKRQTENSDEDDPTERRKFTQRMPEDLVGDIDEFADAHGMSRNAAINMLAKTGLTDFQ